MLTWSDMSQSPWELYHSGYKWIIDIDNDDNWKIMIQNAIINKPYHETQMISSISMRKPSKSSVFSLKIPNILYGSSSKPFLIPPINFLIYKAGELHLAFL